MLCFKLRSPDEVRICDGSSDVFSSDLRYSAMLGTSSAIEMEPSPAASSTRADDRVLSWQSTSGRKVSASVTRVFLPSRSNCQLWKGQVKLFCEPMSSRTSRSEEHTSELQSLMRISYAVFCLKKKKVGIKLFG